MKFHRISILVILILIVIILNLGLMLSRATMHNSILEQKVANNDRELKKLEAKLDVIQQLLERRDGIH